MTCKFAQACGGCPQIEISKKEQRLSKLVMVRALLQQEISGFDVDVRFNEATNSKVGYRNRIRLQVNEKGRLRFFNPEKDPDCVVLLPELRQTIDLVRVALEFATDELLQYSHVEIRAPDLDGQAGVDFVRPADDASSVAKVELTQKRLSTCLNGIALVSFGRLTSRCGVQREDRAWFPHRTQRYPITDEVFQRVPLGGFMQINFEVNRALTERVVEEAKARGVATALDLYCGSGNFLLPLLDAGVRCVGVEKVADSVRAARAAASEQGWEARVAALDISAYLSESGVPGGFDLVVVDPPRAGLKKALEILAGLRAPSLAMCSCNPKTMASDLACLVKRGYRVDSVELFDMFPGTAHVEALCFLSLVSSHSPSIEW